MFNNLWIGFGIGAALGAWLGYKLGCRRSAETVLEEREPEPVEPEASIEEDGPELVEAKVSSFCEIKNAYEAPELEETDAPAFEEPDEPYLVERTNFAPHDCDFETLAYYADVDMLVDMYGDPVENIETLIGRAGIDHLESMPADECGSFYVRNPGIDIVYEVEIIRGIPYGGD